VPERVVEEVGERENKENEPGAEAPDLRIAKPHESGRFSDPKGRIGGNARAHGAPPARGF
jgi:hypothetical protein